LTTTYTSKSKQFVSVYKSGKREEMYLYVERGADFKTLPEPLMASFGAPLHVLDVVLTPEKKLARADARQVLDALYEQGFYLQMPPAEKESLLEPDQVPQAPKDSLNG